jgi:glycosyltransferase involved in cell wall biosynthesis
MKVLIDARLPDSGAGGVQQVVSSLAIGFNSLESDQLQRTWLVLKGTAWWKDSIPKNDQLIFVSVPGGVFSLKIIAKLPLVMKFFRNLFSKIFSLINSRKLSFTIKDFDLYHAPFQDRLDLDIPTIFHPHDLQHVYFPKFFTKSQIYNREINWRYSCQMSKVVIVESESVKNDLVSHWKINPAKIEIIPTPPPSSNNLNLIKPKTQSEMFAFYPAAFWPHKNHLRLLEAWKILKSRGIDLKLVLTGSQGHELRKISKLISKLQLDEMVEIKGHVSSAELNSLIDGAKILIIPSLFESISLPIWEGFLARTPVVASNISGVNRQVGDFGLLFDPYDPGSIAQGVIDMLVSDLDAIASKAHERVSGLTCETFAMAMSGIYRKTLDLPILESQIIAISKLQNATS